MTHNSEDEMKGKQSKPMPSKGSAPSKPAYGGMGKNCSGKKR